MKLKSLVPMWTEWHLLNPQFGQDILGEDVHIMKSKSKWLNERLINAGQRMLAKDYPNACTAGFYDVGLLDTLTTLPRGVSK